MLESLFGFEISGLWTAVILISLFLVVVLLILILRKKLFNSAENSKYKTDTDTQEKSEQPESSADLPSGEYEIIAAIAAAVISSMTGAAVSKFRISSIKRSIRR